MPLTDERRVEIKESFFEASKRIGAALNGGRGESSEPGTFTQGDRIALKRGLEHAMIELAAINIQQTEARLALEDRLELALKTIDVLTDRIAKLEESAKIPPPRAAKPRLKVVASLVPKENAS